MQPSAERSMAKTDQIHFAADPKGEQPGTETTTSERRSLAPLRSESSARSSNDRATFGARKKGASRKFFTIEQVAEEHEVSPRTVQRWIAEGLLVVHRFGRAVRIAELDLLAF